MATWTEQASQDMGKLYQWEDSLTMQRLHDEISGIADRAPFGDTMTIIEDVWGKKLKIAVEVRITVDAKSHRITSVKQRG